MAAVTPSVFLPGLPGAWSPLSAHRAMHDLVPGRRRLVVTGRGHMRALERPGV